MAHLLTIVWLAFWIAAQLLCWRLYSSNTSRRSYWQVAVLVSCLSVMLFPVISNDDDAAWARQIQIDFESVGVTQTTRAFSRLELPAEFVAHPALTVFLPPVLSTSRPIVSEVPARPNTSHFHVVPVLRGPPAHV